MNVGDGRSLGHGPGCDFWRDRAHDLGLGHDRNHGHGRGRRARPQPRPRRRAVAEALGIAAALAVREAAVTEVAAWRDRSMVVAGRGRESVSLAEGVRRLGGSKRGVAISGS